MSFDLADWLALVGYFWWLGYQAAMLCDRLAP